MILRVRQPDAPRKFKVPGGPILVPVLGILSSLTLVCTATPATILRLVVWMGIGLVVYFAFGFRYSKLRTMTFPSSSISPRVELATIKETPKSAKEAPKSAKR